MAIVNTHYGYCGGNKLPELAGTWVLNERLYAPENNFNETVKFTAIAPAGGARTYKSMYIESGILMCERTTGFIDGWYTFSNNKWSVTFRTIKFNEGATASDTFRAWLARNATKQS